MSPYRWPTPDAVRAINALFCLPAHGKEQDWEIELADGTRIPEFLSALSRERLDLECRSALALLALHSFTYPEPAVVTSEMVASARWTIQRDGEVRDRMLSYWSDGFLEHEGHVRAILR
jgi:hypothetical protein